jgi:transglycosylase-like protein
MSPPRHAFRAGAAVLAVGAALAAVEPIFPAQGDPPRVALAADARPPVPLHSVGPPLLSPELERIAACESTGDPAAIGWAGVYRGKFQFDHETWQAVGGTGDPAAAPEAEQDRRAIALYELAGAAPWPVCGELTP